MRLLPDVGLPELLLILVIVMMIFGVGKLPEIGSALGKGIREFHRYSSAHDEAEPTPPSPPTALLSAPSPPLCQQCGQPLVIGARFCSQCGMSVIAATAPPPTTVVGHADSRSQVENRAGKAESTKP